MPPQRHTYVTHEYLQEEFGRSEKDINEIKDTLKGINTKLDVLADTRNDVTWLKKFFWYLAGGVITSLTTDIIRFMNR